MRKFTRYAVVPMAIGSLSACADQMSGPTGPQGQLELNVAPLNLPGITNASYDLWVTNGSGTDVQTVWSEANITSAAYGDSAGAVTYIGTCDATRGVHTVHLKMNSLSTAAQADLFAIGEAQNPCIVDCPITAPCTENTDTLVTYNLAIMRDADQGFFDIAVNFEDIFCSAKVDCNTKLLNSGADRVPTAIVGFACTSGSTTTFLAVNYGTGIDGSGNVTGGFNEAQDGNDAGGSYAVYKDMEELSGGFAKGFWNLAVKIPDGGLTVAGYATASQGALPSAGAQKYNSYPVIKFNVALNKTCTAATYPVQLDDGSGGVATQYVSDPAALLDVGTDGVSAQVNGSF